MADSIQGKVVIVTGASSGIGAATAAELVAAGARVVAAARRLDRLDELAKRLDARDDRFLAVQCDIRDERDAERLVERALGWGGRLDALINNAGLSRGARLESSSTDDIRLMLDTNVFGLANLTRLAVPALRKSRGSLVNVSSTVVKALIPGSSVYSATKAAVAAFSEVMRKELCADNVRVIDVYPGMVDTEFFDHFDEQKKKSFDEMRAAMEVLKGADVAEAIVFALTRPPHVSLNEIVIRPTMQPV